MSKKISKLLVTLSLVSAGVILVKGGAVEGAIQDAKVLFYGIAAGIAALLLVIYGVKLKLSFSLEERQTAKRAIIYVILGLILIIIGAVLVELIYRIPPQPPAPRIINARAWALSNPLVPWDNQTGLEFDFENKLSENLTGIVVEVSSLKHSWCDEDLFRYIFPKIGIVHAGNTESYSYDNFCENSNQFSIQVKADQNWWTFCVDCPPSPGGNCNVSLGSC